MLRSQFAFVNSIYDLVTRQRAGTYTSGGQQQRSADITLITTTPNTTSSDRHPDTITMAWADALSAIGDRLNRSTASLSEKSSQSRSWLRFLGRASDSSKPGNAEPIRETAWLDGLRGTAAFLVMTYHFHLIWFGAFGIEASYGATEEHYELWRLPFIRLWMCSGHTQVSIFFVLSGFVLSWSTLGHMKAGRNDKILNSLSSAMFRRWWRLYMPCWGMAFIYMLCHYFYLIDLGALGERKANLFLQIWHVIGSDERFSNPFEINRIGWTAVHEYDATMWTIPYEFSGSMLVFCILLGICRFRDYRRRFVATTAITAYACLNARWYFFLFCVGLCFSDYIRWRGGFQKIAADQSRQVTLAWTAVLIVALYVAGLPEPSPNYSMPGYDFLMNFVPHAWHDIEGGGRWWWSWSGIFIVLSASHLSSVQRLFDAPVTRYLGRISYMLYLSHRLTLQILGTPIKKFIFPIFGKDVVLNQPPNILVTGILCYIAMWLTVGSLAIFIGHWLTVYIDEPSVHFAKWLETIFLGSDGSHAGANGHVAAPAAVGARRAVEEEQSAHLLAQDRDSLPLHR